MKILFTIIRNGISRGIPEGTKVPEKPNSNLFVSTEARAFGMDERGYVKAMKKHERDLQALWDSSIEWEDQRLVNENLFASRDKISEAELAEFALTGKHRDGIYPLEGVNGEQIWEWKQFYGKYSTLGVDGFDWRKCDETLYNLYKRENVTVRTFLRLIPQPNSEQKKDALGGLPEIEYPESLPNRIEGTEVSEPTVCENDDCIITGRCCYHECVAGLTINQKILKEGEIMELPTLEEMREDCPGITLQDYEEMKIELNKQLKNQVFGVEKKEPETWSHQNFCKKCQLLTAHISANNVCIVCGTVNFRGVSEGEPNQEELWIEALKYLRHMLGSYSTTIHKAKGMAEYFHIQKLKP